MLVAYSTSIKLEARGISKGDPFCLTPDAFQKNKLRGTGIKSFQQKKHKFEIDGIVKSNDKHHGKCLSHTSQLHHVLSGAQLGTGVVS